MTIAEQLRKAALGPTPKHPEYADAWVSGEAWQAVRAYVGRPEPPLLSCMADDERRMFLLFCSYAAEGEQ